MKRKKRRIFPVLFILMIIGIAACDQIPTTKKAITPAGTGAAGAADTGTAAATEAAAPASGDVTIAEQVLMESNGLRVTAKALVNDSIWGPGLKVLVENTSTQNIGVNNNYLCVNNYMLTSLFSCSVAAGKAANDTIYFGSSALSQAGITTISEIAMDFHLFDSSSYQGIADTPEAIIRTSAAEGFVPVRQDEGTELYNQNGIRIVGKYVEEGTLWGSGVVLFMENTSPANVIIQCDNLSINGFMTTPFFSCQVNSTRMALDEITIMKSDLESNNITSVDTVEVNFKIIDPASFTTLYESGPVSFGTNSN